MRRAPVISPARLAAQDRHGMPRSEISRAPRGALAVLAIALLAKAMFYLHW